MGRRRRRVDTRTTIETKWKFPFPAEKQFSKGLSFFGSIVVYVCGKSSQNSATVYFTTNLLYCSCTLPFKDQGLRNHSNNKLRFGRKKTKEITSITFQVNILKLFNFKLRGHTKTVVTTEICNSYEHISSSSEITPEKTSCTQRLLKVVFITVLIWFAILLNNFATLIKCINVKYVTPIQTIQAGNKIRKHFYWETRHHTPHNYH